MAKSRLQTKSGARRRPKAPAAASAAQGLPTMIRIPKTADVVASNIRKMIIRGQIKNGDFLPPEAQLMEHFRTSRPTIREAFRILENEQFISVTRGSRSGALVHSPRVDSVARYAGFALQAQGTLLSDIYEARLGVEPFAVRLAAERRTDAEVRRLRGEVEQTTTLLESKGVGPEFRIAVAKLHLSIVEVARSNTLTMLAAVIQGVIETHQAKFVSWSAPGNAEERAEQLSRNRRALKSFTKVIDLIEAKKGDEAEKHWVRHIENANAAWLAGHDRTAIVDVLD